MRHPGRLAAGVALGLPFCLAIQGCSGESDSIAREAASALVNLWRTVPEASARAARSDPETPASPSAPAAAETEPPPQATGSNANPQPPAPRVYYQFVDGSGSLRFVESLEQVPVAKRNSARRMEVESRLSSNSPARPEPRLREGTGARPWAATANAPWERRATRVVVYTAPWCGWCRKTLAYLDRKGVAYSNRDIEASSVYRDELLRKTGSASIPVVEIGDELVRGYDPSAYERLLF